MYRSLTHLSASTSRQLQLISNRSFSQSTRLLIPSKTFLTLYAKTGCSLCDKAKVVVEEVRGNDNLKKPIAIQYVDITDPVNKEWWDAYCFDVPVLHLDVKEKETVKFMHYLDAGKIIDEVNKDVEGAAVDGKFASIVEAL